MEGTEQSNKKRTIEEPRVISRTSPNSLYEAIKGMTQEQKNLIESIGFGDILKIRFNELPIRLSCHVLNEFISGNIVITKENIRDILGVPSAGRRIVTGKRCKKNNVVTKFWNKQFENMKANVIGPASVLQEIKGGKDISDEDAKQLFVLNFLVLFATCFVEGDQVGSCNKKFLHYISSIDKVSKLDWCGYIFECLCEARQNWCEVKGLYFCGSVSILIVHYLDSKCVGDKRKGLEWTTDELKTEDEELNEKGVREEKKPKKQKRVGNKGQENEKGVEGEQKPKRQKSTEEEKKSGQDPENKTDIEIEKKMGSNAESSRKAWREDITTSAEDTETWNGDTISVCVGPFHARMENAPSDEDTRLSEWNFDEQARVLKSIDNKSNYLEHQTFSEEPLSDKENLDSENKSPLEIPIFEHQNFSEKSTSGKEITEDIEKKSPLTEDPPHPTIEFKWRGNAVGLEAKALFEAIEHSYPNTFQRVHIRVTLFWLNNLKALHAAITSFMGSSVDALVEEEITTFYQDFKDLESLGFDLSWAHQRLDMVARLKFGKEPLHEQLMALEQSIGPLKERVNETMGQLMKAHDMYTNALSEYEDATEALKQKAKEMAQKYGSKYDQVLKDRLGFGMLPGY